MGISPFKIVAGADPLSPLDIMPKAIDEKPSVAARKRVEEILKLHQQVTPKIKKSNASY